MEHPNRPASWYEFELLNKSGPRQGVKGSAPQALHLHFKVRSGQSIGGELQVQLFIPAGMVSDV